MDDLQFQYVEGQSRASFAALLAEFEAESQAATTTESCALDVRYGPLERQTFDFFTARRSRGARWPTSMRGTGNHGTSRPSASSRPPSRLRG